MTNDEIIRIAKEAGIIETLPAEDEYPAVWSASTPELKKFADLVAATVRELFALNGIHTCHNQCQRPVCVAIRKAVAAEREACAEIVGTHRIPVGNSAAGEMACEWTYNALKEVYEAICARGGNGN